MELVYFGLIAFGLFVLYSIIHYAVRNAITDSKDLITAAVLKAISDTKTPEIKTDDAAQQSPL